METIFLRLSKDRHSWGLFVVYFFASLVLCSCSHKVEIPVMDYGAHRTPKFPEWECHQILSIKRDIAESVPYLEVMAFPLNKYPGISLPWMGGDWRQFDTFEIVARKRGGSEAFFSLSVWDGEGDYIVSNRFTKKFRLDTNWTSCVLALSGGLVTPGRRRMRMSHINQIVFFTERRTEPSVFNVSKILMYGN